MGVAPEDTIARPSGYQAGFVDLHVHLLPGVDDGPGNLDATLALARLAAADGIVCATATPHVASVVVEEIPERVGEVRAALAEAAIPIEVHAGGELGARGVGRLSADELRTIAHGPPGARWILLEAPLDGAVGRLHRAADELRCCGYGVVLAHPERCGPLFEDDMRELRKELERGAVTQVSSSSLVGMHGTRARRNAARLVAERHAGLIATDAHGPRRPPSLTAAVAAAFRLGLTVAEARSLVAERPRALLERGLGPQPLPADAIPQTPTEPPAPSSGPEAPPSYAAGSPDVSRAARRARARSAAGG
ncbi:MAG: capsular polysaccharide biosynthesis protein [Conexibacter sp.]|nr:capsular polysaccharide biosynthesis protein [Conexibacter sp.]